MYHFDFSCADRHTNNKETKKYILMLDAIIFKKFSKMDRAKFLKALHHWLFIGYGVWILWMSMFK